MFGHPVRKPRVSGVGVSGEGIPGDIAVAFDVVARHDRRGRYAALAPAFQGSGDEAEHVDLGQVVELVTTLGDRQRDDAGARCGQQLDHALRVVGCVPVVDDRPDDPCLASAVRVFQQQGVQAVLRGHHVGHLAIGGQHADPADAPPVGQPRVEEPIDIGGLMRPVKAADPEMHNADTGFGPGVRRGGNGQLPQRSVVEVHVRATTVVTVPLVGPMPKAV